MALVSILNSVLAADNFADLIQQIASSATTNDQTLRKEHIRLARELLQFDDSGYTGSGASLLKNTKTVALVAGTPMSYADIMASSTPTAMNEDISVFVVNDANGEVMGLRTNPVAKTVTSDLPVASVTITVYGY